MGENKTVFGIVSALAVPIAIIAAIAILVFILKNPHLIYSDYRAECVEEDGTVVVSMEFIYEDVSDPTRTAFGKVGEPANPFGFRVADLEQQDSGLYEVMLLISGDNDPRLFDHVPPCSDGE